MLDVKVNQGSPPFKLRVTFETQVGAAHVVVTEPSPQALIRLSYMLKGDKGDKGDTGDAGEPDFFDYNAVVAATLL